MKLWNLFKGGQRDAQRAAPDPVLAALLDAVAREDARKLVDLCNEHAATIFERFQGWQNVPDDIRSDHARLNHYVQALTHVATLFEQAGYPELMAALTGEQDGNPLVDWEETLARAAQLVHSGKLEEGLAIVSELLETLAHSGASGSGLVSVRTRALGLMGDALAKLGRRDEARQAFQAALADCEECGDADGVGTFRNNLSVLDDMEPISPGGIDAEIAFLEKMQLAQRRTDLRRYEASNTLLQSLLDADGASAPIINHFYPHILGRMAFNDFKLGKVEAARAKMIAARDACLDAHDEASAEIYAENLAFIDQTPGS